MGYFRNDREPSMLDLAKRMQRARIRMAKLFPRDVFRDSAWEMMLELFIAGQLKRVVCVKELILASGEKSTSALRRIDRLEAADMLRRCHDPVDHRRHVVMLTAKGDAAMHTMLLSLFDPEYAPDVEGRAPLPTPFGDIART